jgi:hypothetical protein
MIKEKIETTSNKGEETTSDIGIIKEEKVEVSKGLLDSIQKELKDLKADREMFMEMADERRKALYYSRHQEQLPANVFVRTLTIDEKGQAVEKVVLGWKTLKDEVFKDPATMRWQEIQKLELIFEDGTSKEMFLLDWIRGYKQVKAVVLSRRTEEITGEIILNVKRIDNGRQYDIGVEFIN